jgi:hypothetical protein
MADEALGTYMASDCGRRKKNKTGTTIRLVELPIAVFILYIYSGQLEVMRGQLEQMEGSSQQTNNLILLTAHQVLDTHELASQAKFSSALQVQIARLNNPGAVAVNLTPWMGFFYQGDKLFAQVGVQNSGRAPIKTIAVAAKMRSRNTLPNYLTDYNFNDTDFSETQPNSLPAHEVGSLPFTGRTGPNDRRTFEAHTVSRNIDMDELIPHQGHKVLADKTIYVWGKIRFRDYTGELAPGDIPFCRYIAASTIFKADQGQSGGTSPGEDCDKKP